MYLSYFRVVKYLWSQPGIPVYVFELLVISVGGMLSEYWGMLICQHPSSELTFFLKQRVNKQIGVCQYNVSEGIAANKNSKIVKSEYIRKETLVLNIFHQSCFEMGVWTGDSWRESPETLLIQPVCLFFFFWPPAAQGTKQLTPEYTIKLVHKPNPICGTRKHMKMVQNMWMAHILINL